MYDREYQSVDSTGLVMAASPQADVMPMATIDEPPARTGKSGELEGGICIRRSALVDSDDGEDEEQAGDWSRPEVETALRARMAELYGPVSVASGEMVVSVSDADGGSDDRSDGQQEFEFRLFGGMAQKIVLRENEGMGDGAFVKLRDPRVFALPPAEGQRKEGFEHMAVTGEEVFQRSRRRAWGLEVPWRVKVIGKRIPLAVMNITAIKVGQEKTGRKKTKPNKKGRILLRERAKKEDEIARRTKIEENSREEAEREKKSRKNREKKLKKRAKEKQTK